MKPQPADNDHGRCVNPATAPAAPRITGWLTIDLTPYVDRDGFLTREGEHHAWRVICSASPDGINVRLNIGGMRSVISWGLLTHLADGGIFSADNILVEGTDGNGVRAVTGALAQLRDQYGMAAA